VAEDTIAEFVPYYRNQQLIEHAAPVLAEQFEQRVYALIEEMESRLPFVGLSRFKKVELARALEGPGGILLSELILDYMIKQGKLEVGKVKTEFSEYETSTLRRVK